MSKSYIPKALRQKVAEQAGHRCGYCLTPAAKARGGMSIEHIIPEALGGLTEENNLWLACYYCNSYKGDLISAPDPFSGLVVPLYNPRVQTWKEHFAWQLSEDEQIIITGRTAIGRATVEALKLNRPHLLHARKSWLAGGWKLPALP